MMLKQYLRECYDEAKVKKAVRSRTRPRADNKGPRALLAKVATTERHMTPFKFKKATSNKVLKRK